MFNRLGFSFYGGAKLARRTVDQNRSEGIDGDPYELRLADISGLIRSSRLSYKQISQLTKGIDPSGVCPATISKLWGNETSRPHDRTIDLIGQALGYERVWVLKGARPEGTVSIKPHWPEEVEKASRSQNRRIAGMSLWRQKQREKAASKRKGKRKK